MTIMELRCFIAVARNRSYSKAAKSLFISQPAVSRHILTLEQELGVALLNRNRQTVSLTATGTRFLPEAEDIVERVDLSQERIQHDTGNEAISIGVATQLQVHYLSNILQSFHSRLPDVMISCTEIATFEFERVAAGDMDIAFVSRGAAFNGLYADARLKYRRLYIGRMACVVPRTHPLATREMVDLEDLAGETLILLDHEHCPPEMDETQLMIRRKRKDLKYFFSGSSVLTVPMIKAGLGIAVMPDFACPPDPALAVIPADIECNVEYGLISKANEKSAKVQELVSIATGFYRDAEAKSL